jgi:hypothetical protein
LDRREAPARWRVITLSVVIAALLAGNGLALAQASRSRRPPKFSTGGDFSVAAPAPEQPVEATTTTAAPGPPPSVSTTMTRRDARPREAGAAPAAPAAATGRPGPPVPGTYTFSLSGTESASIVGSRSFPSRMTLVVHGASGLGADTAVLDYTYSSQHEEREVAIYRSDGVFLTHEGGSITFGLVTETSDVAYDTPLGHVPFPLAVGTARSGTSTGRHSGGDVERVDDWRVSITGRETVTAAGQAVDAWVVAFERQSRPGNEVVRQRMTLWFDAGRGLPVRVQDEIHGERKSGLVTLIYDAHYTATLVAAPPPR